MYKPWYYYYVSVSVSLLLSTFQFVQDIGAPGCRCTQSNLLDMRIIQLCRTIKNSHTDSHTDNQSISRTKLVGLLLSSRPHPVGSHHQWSGSSLCVLSLIPCHMSFWPVSKSSVLPSASWLRFLSSGVQIVYSSELLSYIWRNSQLSGVLECQRTMYFILLKKKCHILFIWRGGWGFWPIWTMSK